MTTDRKMEAAFNAYMDKYIEWESNHDGQVVIGCYREALEAALEAAEQERWLPISEAPYNRPILGKVVQKPTDDQKTGIEQGWLRMPTELPYVCQLIPECDEYGKSCQTLNMYGTEEDNDAAYPTHFQFLPTPPEENK